MKFLLYSTFLLFLAPCNGTKKAISTETAKTQKATSAGSVKVQEGGPKTTIITFERSVCFGSCPAFTMTIAAETNKATYVGTSNVEKIGTFEKSFSDEDIAKLKDAFDKAKFFDMENEYSSQISDIPSTYVSLTYAGNTKKIKDKQHAPKELKDLEKMLDDIANSDGWVKVKDKE